MLKKTLFLLSFLLIGASLVMAQNMNLMSAESEVSGGVFGTATTSLIEGVYGNELDAALSVIELGNRPYFSELKGNYLFGGLSNLERAITDTSFTATATNPLYIGYYSSGAMPWSVFAGIHADGSASLTSGETAIPFTSTPPGTTSYTYNRTVTKTEYTKSRLFNALQLPVQFLTRLGDMNLGGYIRIDHTDNSPQANNYKQTITYYYDKTAGAAAPDLDTDRTYTDTQTDYASNNTFTLGVPLFFKTGSLSHYANLTTSLNLIDNSTTRSMVYSDNWQTNSGLQTNTEADNTIDTSSQLDVRVNYQLGMPAIFTANPKNYFVVSANANVGFGGQQLEEVFTTQDMTWAGGKVAGTKGERDDDSFKTENGIGLDFGLGGGAAHAFYFEPLNTLQFGFIPRASVSFSVNNPVNVNKWVSINQVDNNADGDFNDNLDQKTTTTYEYTNVSAIDIATGAINDSSDSIITVTTTIAAPVAARISPEGWPFKVIIGSVPSFTMTNTFTNTSSGVAKRTVVAETVGAATTTTTTEANPSVSTSQLTNAFTISAVHSIGLAIPFADVGRLDVNLNLGTATSILDFKNIVVQLIIKA